MKVSSGKTNGMAGDNVLFPRIGVHVKVKQRVQPDQTSNPSLAFLSSVDQDHKNTGNGL